MDSGIVQKCLGIDPRFSTKNCKQSGVMRWFALVLPYHPSLHSLKLNSILQSTFRDFEYEISNLFGANVGFRLAWKKSDACLGHKLRFLSRHRSNNLNGWLAGAEEGLDVVADIH